jgi:phosphate-selective porin OprO and OprP
LKSSSTTDIVDALVSKGVLTEEEGKLITKGHESKKEKTLEGKFKDGFVIENSDGSNSMKIGGRLHMDYRNFNRDVSPLNSSTSADKEADTFDVRRARLELSGTFRKYYDYLLSTDLSGATTGNSSTTTSVNILDQAYLNVKWIPQAQLRFGQFKQPMNLEKLTSSNNIDFQERSVVNQLVGNEDRGAMVWGEPRPGFTYALGAFTGIGGKNRNDIYARNDDLEFTGRLTANFAQFVDNKDAVVHLGLSGSTTQFDKQATAADKDGWLAGTSKLRTEARGLEFLTLPALSSSTTTSNTIKRQRGGLEGVFAYNNMKLQGEYVVNNFKGTTAGTESTAGVATNISFDNKIEAGYIEALYMITGEKYADFYKGGAFGGIKPKNEFNFDTLNGIGAWEVGLRYSVVDASDFSSIYAIQSNGGTFKADTTVLGLKWIPNNNMRIMLNAVYTSFDTPIALANTTAGGSTSLANSETAITTRVQFMF